MIKTEVTDYQPGTGTRYLLVHGIVDDIDDIRRLSCQPGSLLLAWEGHGVYEFTTGTVPPYIAEKMNIPEFMLDAIALTQFVMVKLNAPIHEELMGTKWKVCDQCHLPVYLKKEDSECYCKQYPMF